MPLTDRDLDYVEKLFSPTIKALESRLEDTRRQQVLDENDRVNLRKEFQDNKTENYNSHKRMGERLERIEQAPDKKLAEGVRGLRKLIITVLITALISGGATFLFTKILVPHPVQTTTQDNTKTPMVSP